MKVRYTAHHILFLVFTMVVSTGFAQSNLQIENIPFVRGTVNDSQYFNQDGARILLNTWDVKPLLGQQLTKYPTMQIIDPLESFPPVWFTRSPFGHEDTLYHIVSSFSTNDSDSSMFAYIQAANGQLRLLKYDSGMELIMDKATPSHDQHGIVDLNDSIALVAVNKDSSLSIAELVSFLNIDPPPDWPPGETMVRLLWQIVAKINIETNEVLQSWSIIDDWEETDTFPVQWLDDAVLNSQVFDFSHWNHTAIDLLDGGYLISFRHVGVYKIDAAMESVVWKFGNGNSTLSNAGGMDEVDLHLQHYFYQVAEGKYENVYCVFDNGDAAQPFSKTILMEVDDDEQTYSIVREIDHSPAFGVAMGNSEVINDGAVLVNYGVIDSEEGQPEIIIVDTLDNMIAEYRIDDNYVVSYQAHYRDLSYVSRPAIDFMDIDDECHVVAGNGYSGYLWSDGDTNRVRAIDDLPGDSLFLMAKYGVGWVCSSLIDVNDCDLITGVEPGMAESRLLNVFPNPVNDFLHLPEEGTVMIFDSRAKLIYVNSHVEQNEIDVTEFPSGLYHLMLFSSSGSFHAKFIKY